MNPTIKKSPCLYHTCRNHWQGLVSPSVHIKVAQIMAPIIAPAGSCYLQVISERYSPQTPLDKHFIHLSWLLTLIFLIMLQRSMFLNYITPLNSLDQHRWRSCMLAGNSDQIKDNLGVGKTIFKKLVLELVIYEGLWADIWIVQNSLESSCTRQSSENHQKSTIAHQEKAP